MSPYKCESCVRDGAGKLRIVLSKTRKSTVELDCDEVQRRAIRFINNYSLCTHENYSLYPPSTCTHPLTCSANSSCFLPRFISSPLSVMLCVHANNVPRLHSVLCVCGTLLAFYAPLRMK